MNNIWKWMLGIFIALMLVAVGWFGWQYLAWGGYYGGMSAMHGFDGRFNPMYGGFNRGGYPAFGMLPFVGMFFLGGALRLFLPVGVLVLTAFFSYQAGTKAGMRTVNAPQPAGTPAPDPVEPFESESVG